MNQSSGSSAKSIKNGQDDENGSRSSRICGYGCIWPRSHGIHSGRTGQGNTADPSANVLNWQLGLGIASLVFFVLFCHLSWNGVAKGYCFFFEEEAGKKNPSALCICALLLGSYSNTLVNWELLGYYYYFLLLMVEFFAIWLLVSRVASSKKFSGQNQC